MKWNERHHMHAAIFSTQKPMKGSDRVQIVHVSFIWCARASSVRRDDQTLLWQLTTQLIALLMRPLNGKTIDLSVYEGSNCISLQPVDREPNKHRRLTPQIRLCFYYNVAHQVENNAFKNFWHFLEKVKRWHQSWQPPPIKKCIHSVLDRIKNLQIHLITHFALLNEAA